MVRPIVSALRHRGRPLSQCRRRVQGRHRLHTSDALGAAGVQLGPERRRAGRAAAHAPGACRWLKVTHLLRTQFGLTVTPGGLAQVLHRTALPSRADLHRTVPAGAGISRGHAG